MKTLYRILTVFLASQMAVSPVYACSFFVVHDAKRVLAGNNEDNFNANTWVWFSPSVDSKYGCIYFGYEDRFPQGGMNDKGLFYDGAAMKRLPVKGGVGKKKLSLPKLFMTVMETCASVDEVIELLEQHDLSRFERAQMLYADASGDSVLVEGDVMIRGTGKYQIATNFYQSQVTDGQIPCGRYARIDAILKSENEVSVELVRRALAAAHQEGATPTQYSNICDLVNLRVYLYHFHNFEEPIVFDLRKELAKGKREARIRDLFNEDFAAQDYRLKWELAQKSRPKNSWILTNLNSIVALIIGTVVGGVIVGIIRQKNTKSESTS